MKRRPTAQDVMSRPVRRLTTGVGVRAGAEFLLRMNISGALVVDGHGRPVGVFSLRDLAAHLQKKLVQPGRLNEADAFERTTVGEVMTPAVLTVAPEASLGMVARLMALWKVHRVFVEERGEIRGVVTTMDLLKWVDGMLPPGRAKRSRGGGALRLPVPS